MKNIILYSLLLLSFNIFSQKFVVVDKDTYDFIESVPFTIYKDNKVVYEDVTKNNKATRIPEDLEYDKIEFSKTDYKTHTIETENLNGGVYLTKEHIQLDEVVISSKKSDHIVLGESNRIRNARSVPFISKLNFGIVFHNYQNNDLTINQTIFYVDKVKYKTAYKINFFDVEESLPVDNLQTLQFNKKIYSTDTLYLQPKQKNRIEIKHKDPIVFEEYTTLFVSLELLYYLNEDDQKFTPKNKNKTKLKFQLSNENNFYTRTVDANSGKYSDYLLNSNLMVKYDFANYLFKTPHKSILITPAINLYATEVKL